MKRGEGKEHGKDANEKEEIAREQGQTREDRSRKKAGGTGREKD